MAKIQRPDRSSAPPAQPDLDEEFEVVFDEPEAPPPRWFSPSLKQPALAEPCFDLESVLEEIDALDLEPDDAFLSGDRDINNKLASETVKLNPAVPAKTTLRTAAKPTAAAKPPQHGKRHASPAPAASAARKVAAAARKPTGQKPAVKKSTHVEHQPDSKVTNAAAAAAAPVAPGPSPAAASDALGYEVLPDDATTAVAVSDSDVDLLFDPRDPPTSGFGPFRGDSATAVAEPPKQSSRTAKNASGSVKKPAVHRMQPTYQRTAQPSLATGRGSAIPTAVATLVAITVLSAVGTWLFSGPSGPPQARYLPRDCDLVISMTWSDVPPSDATPTSPTNQSALTIPANTARQKLQPKPREDLPGLMLVERCRLFLRNAGLSDEDVERINAGRAADGSGMVIVYQLSRAVRAQVVADLHPFRSRRKSAGPTETIGGVPLYSLGPTVIAFPEAQVIINGETELVRQVLERWSHGMAEPLRAYLQAADLSATSVVISARGTEPLWKDDLQVPSQLADRVRGTTASCRYGDQFCLTQTFHLDAAQAGDELQTALQSSLGAAAKDPKTPPALREPLTQARVSASKGHVQIDFALPATQLHGKCLEMLNRLF